MAGRLNHAERQLQLLELCRINGNQPVPVFLLQWWVLVLTFAKQRQNLTKNRGWPDGHPLSYLEIGLLLEVTNSVVNLLALVLAVEQEGEVVCTQP